MGYSCYSLEFGSFYLIYDGSSPSSQLQGVTSAELTQSVRLSANGLLMALCSSMYHDRDVDVFIPRVVGGQKLKLAWRGELLFVSRLGLNRRTINDEDVQTQGGLLCVREWLS